MAGSFMLASMIIRGIRQRRQAAALRSAPLPPGGSLLNTSIEEISKQMTTEANIAIQLSNYSHKYNLRNPRIHTSSGYSHNPPPPTIQKRTIEACSFSKPAGAACAVVGVLMYEIYQHKHRDRVGDLVIMFSVDCKLNENWIALGIFKEYVSCDEQLLQRMFYDCGSFTRAKSTGSEISFYERHAYVKGTMSPTGRAIMKIELWDL